MGHSRAQSVSSSSGPGSKIAISSALLLSLAACSSMGASGPSSGTINSVARNEEALATLRANIQVIDVTDAVARRVLNANRLRLFSEALGSVPPLSSTVSAGDALQVTIWESPPALLFGTNATFGSGGVGNLLGATAGVSQSSPLPEMMVDSDGLIRIPFAGAIEAAGRTPAQIEREIVRRLTGKANAPQVIVRTVTNSRATVTVVGDVGSNTRVTLTPRGERLLDVIASAGGVKQPVGKTTIQITRNNQVVALPLDVIIRDPAQNVRLQPDDVVTALYQPFSFTALGATGTSAEILFEGTGLTLSQALGRVGGLRPDRANVRGVFIFRLEEPGAVDPAIAATARRTPEGLIPVIYRVDLANPASFFVAQSFPIRNRDVLYVSSAPLSDLQRFMSIISSMAFTVIGLGQAVP